MNNKEFLALIIEKPYITKPSVIKELTKKDSLSVVSNILESFQSDDIISELEIINESYSPISKSGKVGFRAIVQESTQINKNGRYYPPEVLQEAVEYFKAEIRKRGGLPAEVDHPFVETSDPQVLKRRASQIFIKEVGVLYKNIDFDGKRVIVEGVTLDNPKGQMVYSLIKEGYNVGFSLRAFGKVVPINENGQSYLLVEKLEKPLTYDVVINPSHQSARLVEIQENEIITPDSISLLTESEISSTPNVNKIIPGSVIIPEDILEKIKNSSNNTISITETDIDEDLKQYIQRIMYADDVSKINVTMSDDTVVVCVNNEFCKAFDKNEFITKAVISYVERLANEIIDKNYTQINAGYITPLSLMTCGPRMGLKKYLQMYWQYNTPNIDESQIENINESEILAETFIDELFMEKFDYDLNKLSELLEYIDRKLVPNIDISQPKSAPLYTNELFEIGFNVYDENEIISFIVENEQLAKEIINEFDNITEIEREILKTNVMEDIIDYDEEEPEEIYEFSNDELNEYIDKLLAPLLNESIYNNIIKAFEKLFFEKEDLSNEKINKLADKILENISNSNYLENKFLIENKEILELIPDKELAIAFLADY